MDEYENKLLEGWEDNHRKAQLTLWILSALYDGPKHMGAIKESISAATNDTVFADDKSVYRALRRFHKAELISFHTEPSSSGPDLKVYELTRFGRTVLANFVERNITSVFTGSQLRRFNQISSQTEKDRT